MIERRFSRSSQPATVLLGGRELTALDWSPEGFRLGTGLAHGYQGKWYPIRMVINSPDKPVTLRGKAQARWSNALESGFIFELEEDSMLRQTLPENPLETQKEPITRSAKTKIIYESKKHGQEPPLLTQIVQNGRLKGSSKHTPSLTLPPELENKLHTNVARLVGFKTAKIIAHTVGRIVTNHLVTGSNIDKHAPILSFDFHERNGEKTSLLKQQAREKAKLEAIQSELIRCETLSRSIDADSEINLPAQSRKLVATTLAKLNHAHELQKGCKAPLEHYKIANMAYRKSRQKHQQTIENLDAIGAQSSQKQLDTIQKSVNALRQKHTKTINRLREVSDNLSKQPESRSSTIYAPFPARVKSHSSFTNRSFKQGETLAILEDITAPILDILIPQEQSIAITSAKKLRVKLPRLGVSMEGKISRIAKVGSPKKESATTEEPSDTKTLYIARITLKEGFSTLKNYAKIKGQPAVIYWPTGQ